MSPTPGNPSWIERGWSLWIQGIRRLPRTVLLCVALLTAAGGAYVLAGHPAAKPWLESFGLAGVATPSRPEPAFEREIVLRAQLREGYDSAELADATQEAARALAARRELFSDVEIRFAELRGASRSTAEADNVAGGPSTSQVGVSPDAIRRAEERLAFWQGLSLQADGSVSPAELWRRLARQGEFSPMHALEADGLLFVAAQRVSRADDSASEAEARARLIDTFDTFWSLSAAIAPQASEARVFARLTPSAASDARQRGRAHETLTEGLDAVRLRWPSVAWTPSGPGYARIVLGMQPSGPTWWDLVTLLGAGALAASAAGDLRRFAAAALAAIVAGGAAYALAWSVDFEGLISPSALALALAVWTTLVATLLLSSLAGALESERSREQALARAMSGAGTAALLPLLIASVVYGIAAAGDVPGAGALFRVVAAWSIFSSVVWTAFFPAILSSLGRFGAWGSSSLHVRRQPRRTNPGVAAPIGALTVAGTLFLAWGAVHLRVGTEGTAAEQAHGSKAAGVADRRFALYRASSPEDLALTRSRFAALDAVDATAAGTDGRSDGDSPEGIRLRSIAEGSRALPRATPLADEPDWAAFTDELRSETSEESPASTSQRRRLADAALSRTARMRPADVDRALRQCFEAWLARRDREAEALAAFGLRNAAFVGASGGGAREADRFYAADGSPLLWIFPKPGLDSTTFVAELRNAGVEVGGPAVSAAKRSEQRRRFGLQAAAFLVGVAAAALMTVLQSLRDVTSVLWAGGCSFAQTLGLAGWLGIPWHEEWLASAPLAAAAWIGTALVHRLGNSRGGGDLWTGAPFATLAASVAAMAVALRWINVGDDASAAAASWWALALAAGWWNGWAYCSRSAAQEREEAFEFEEEETSLALERELQDAPTYVLPRKRAEVVPASDEGLRRSLAESRSFADWDEATERLPFAIDDEDRTPPLAELRQGSPEESYETQSPRRAIERVDVQSVEERRRPTPRREYASRVSPRRRANSREEPATERASTDDAWS